jgi:2,3-dihydroxybiphenyl 1,2-dioxygenase
MAGVSALGYIGWDVKDVAAWDDFLRCLYGLELRADSRRNTRHYRLDERHHRISLFQAKHDAVRFIGWEVETRDDLQALADDLSKNDISVKQGTAAQIKERGVMDLICFEDLDGFKLEIFFTGIIDSAPFRPSRGMAGFNTGALGLGHIVLFCKNKEASIKFYQEVLGFKLSDYIFWPDNQGGTAEGTFLHCNSRHHSLALLNPCFGQSGGQLNHFMLEATSLDDVGRAYDIAVERGYPIQRSIGRHTNDGMTSFYMHSPSGWLMELGFGAVLVDDEVWEPKMYNSTKVWGHTPVSGPKPWPKVGRK